MWDYDFVVTDAGILGTLPTGEQRLFATETEYHSAYEDEEDELYDEMAEAFGWDEVVDIGEY